MSEPKKRNTVAVIEKALTVISFLENTKDGIGLTEIAKQTNMNKTTVYRILQTLMLDNIVEYGEVEGTYRLGFRLLELGEIVQNNIDLRTTLFRSEEHTSELQSRFDLVCRLLLEKKKYRDKNIVGQKDIERTSD